MMYLLASVWWMEVIAIKSSNKKWKPLIRWCLLSEGEAYVQTKSVCLTGWRRWWWWWWVILVVVMVVRRWHRCHTLLKINTTEHCTGEKLKTDKRGKEKAKGLKNPRRLPNKENQQPPANSASPVYPSWRNLLWPRRSEDISSRSWCGCFARWPMVRPLWLTEVTAEEEPSRLNTEHSLLTLLLLESKRREKIATSSSAQSFTAEFSPRRGPLGSLKLTQRTVS